MHSLYKLYNCVNTTKKSLLSFTLFCKYNFRIFFSSIYIKKTLKFRIGTTNISILVESFNVE